MSKGTVKLEAENIAEKYGLQVVRLMPISGGNFIVELNHNIYWKAQQRMEDEFSQLNRVESVAYRSVS